MKSFVFLDRDGTIIKDIPYLSDWRKVSFLPNTIEGLRLLKSLGFAFGIFSNQSGLSRGLITFKQLLEINSYIVSELISEGIFVEFFLSCPHRPIDDCLCRKPKTGLALLATGLNFFNKEHSFMIGDSLTDLQFGANLGVKTIYLTSNTLHGVGDSDFIAHDLFEAAHIINSLRSN
jgi:D-glycero-D-manno-heptose 1,7-bisphosphate phosphatase